MPMTAGLSALTGAPVITTSSAPLMGQFNRYNATSGALSPTLPALSGLNVGARCAVQKYTLDVSSNAVTVSCAGSDKFDDGTTTSFALTTTGDQREIQVVSISGTKRWKTVGTTFTPSNTAMMVVTGSATTPISSAGAARPSTGGAVYWICATGITPTNAILGDIIFNADA